MPAKFRTFIQTNSMKLKEKITISRLFEGGVNKASASESERYWKTAKTKQKIKLSNIFLRLIILISYIWLQKKVFAIALSQTCGYKWNHTFVQVI